MKKWTCALLGVLFVGVGSGLFAPSAEASFPWAGPNFQQLYEKPGQLVKFSWMLSGRQVADQFQPLLKVAVLGPPMECKVELFENGAPFFEGQLHKPAFYAPNGNGVILDLPQILWSKILRFTKKGDFNLRLVVSSTQGQWESTFKFSTQPYFFWVKITEKIPGNIRLLVSARACLTTVGYPDQITITIPGLAPDTLKKVVFSDGSVVYDDLKIRTADYANLAGKFLKVNIHAGVETFSSWFYFPLVQ